MTEKKEKNFPEFRRLLVRAIGPERTKARFAAETGIAPATLSRLINQDEIFRPKMTTLQKIAANAFGGITLQDLALSCGYDVAEVGDATAGYKNTEAGNRRKQTPEVRARLCMEDFERGIAGIVPVTSGYDDLLSFFEEIQMIYCGENTAVELGDAEDAPENSGFPGADERCMITVSFADDSFEVSGAFLLYYNTTKKGRIFPVGAEFRPQELGKAGCELLDEIAEWEDRENIDHGQGIQYGEAPYVVFVREKKERPHLEDYWQESDQGTQSFGLSAQERLIRAIFGGADTRMRSVEGIGFRLPLHISNELIKRFLLKHEASFQSSENEKQMIADIKNGSLVMDAIVANSNYRQEEERWAFGDMIVRIMYRETGINFEPYAGQEATEDQREESPCILFEEKHPWEYNEIERMLSKDTLYQILDRYARELRTDVSRCYFYLEVDRVKGE